MKLITAKEASQLASALGYQISREGIRTAGDRGRLAVARIDDDGTRWYAVEEIQRFVEQLLRGVSTKK